MSKTFGYVVLALVVCALAFGIYSATRMTAPPEASPPRTFGAAGPAAPGPPVPPYCTTAPSDGAAPSCPSSWGQATWVIDRQNTSGCASDGNLTCGQTSCTAGPPGVADGPCASFSQIITRYGTFSPRLRQNTTYTWSSGESTNNDSDPVYFQPYFENQASAFLTGTPTVITTTTLGTITAKSITTSPSLLLAVINTDATALSAGMFMVNTTHAGENWLYANTAGSTWSLSQPLPSAQTTAIGTGIPFGTVGAEQNGYASGDSVTIETFPEVEIANLSPIVEGWNSSFGGGIYVSNIQIQQNGHGARSPLFIGASVLLADVNIERSPASNASTTSMSQANSSNFGYSQEFYNVYTNAVSAFWPMGIPISETSNGSGSFFVAGGVFTGDGTIRLGYPDLQQDVILGASAHGSLFVNGGHGTSVYVDTGTSLSIQGPGAFGMSGTLWGPGGLSVNQNARFAYPSGAGNAVANVLIQGATNIGGLTRGCVALPSDAAAPTCNIALTPSALDTTLGAVSGCVAVYGAGSICNFAP